MSSVRHLRRCVLVSPTRSEGALRLIMTTSQSRQQRRAQAMQESLVNNARSPVGISQSFLRVVEIVERV